MEPAGDPGAQARGVELSALQDVAPAIFSRELRHRSMSLGAQRTVCLKLLFVAMRGQRAVGC